MLKRITVAEALDEKEKLKKEIENAVENMHIAAGEIEESGCLIGSDLNKEEFAKKAKEDYTNVQNLIKKYEQLEDILYASDAITFVETHYGKMTIARAKIIKKELEQNNDVCFFQKIISKMNCEYVGEYYVAAEPPVRCGESHLSGQTEPPFY